MRAHNAEVMGSNPTRVRTPLVRKATGSHFIISTSLERLRALFLVTSTLEIGYTTQLCGGLAEAFLWTVGLGVAMPRPFSMSVLAVH